MPKETALTSPNRRHRRYFSDLGRFYRKESVRVYSGIILSILTVSFFLIFAIRPTFSTIGGLYKEIKDQEEIVKQLEEKINSINQAQAEYRRVQAKLYLIEQALPNDPDLEILIPEIELLVRYHNLGLGALQVEKTKLKGNKSGSQETGFSLTVNGKYSQLKPFVDSLTRLRRIILIDSLVFKSGKATDELNLTLKGKAQFRPI